MSSNNFRPRRSRSDLSVCRCVGLSTASWKNGGSDPDAVWHYRSDESRDEAGIGVWGSVNEKGYFGARHCNKRGLYGVRVRQCLNRRSCGFGVVRAVGRGIAVLDWGSTSCKEKGRFWGSCSSFSQWEMPLGVFDSYAKTFLSANISLESSIRGLFGDVFSFKIKVEVYEELAKSNDCSKKTYAATIAATSIFRTALRLALALAMCAGLAHSVGRSWCGVINSPATTFAVVIKPPLSWETFAATRPSSQITLSTLVSTNYIV